LTFKTRSEFSSEPIGYLIGRAGPRRSQVSRRDRISSRVGFARIDGRDLRWEPIEALSGLLAGCRPGLVVNSVFDNPGPTVFKCACGLGCEGIVSKRRGSRYVAGRTEHWLKVKTMTLLNRLVRAGLATSHIEREERGDKAIEIARVKITDAGRRAL
jgi:hypothetical protein